MGIAMQLPRGCLTIFTLRDAIIPLVRRVGVEFSAAHDMIYSITIMGGAGSGGVFGRGGRWIGANILPACY